MRSIFIGIFSIVLLFIFCGESDNTSVLGSAGNAEIYVRHHILTDQNRYGNCIIYHGRDQIRVLLPGQSDTFRVNEGWDLTAKWSEEGWSSGKWTIKIATNTAVNGLFWDIK